MKAVIAALAVVFCLAFATPAHAWNCTTPNAIRVQVPNGTTGTGTGDGLGQVVVDSGLTFECEILPPTTPPTTTPSSSTSTSSANSAANSSSNSASNSSASSNQSQSQKQGQTQTANGGSATSVATGGAGGNASVGNVSSTSSVSKSGNSTIKNSGNSSNKNSNTATGGNQSQSSTSSASGNGVGNGDNSNNYENVTNVPRDTATAVAPMVLPTVPCFKGIGVGVQGPAFGASFGGGKIDANCAELEASRLAPSLIARCKVYLENKYVKQAGVTLADCLAVPVPTLAVIQAPVAPVPALAPIINITVPPATVIVQAPVTPAPSVAVAAHINATVHHAAHPACKCVYTNEGPVKKSS